MVKFNKETKTQLIELYNTKNITLEGNIAKVIDVENDDDFKNYIEYCINKDRETRKRRLEVTKQVQTQNKELSNLNLENTKIMSELQDTLKNVEDSKSQIEVQNKELITWKQDNERIGHELKEEMTKSEISRINAENAKKNAENDLDVLQKRTQFELINTIVKIALYVIIGVGLTTTVLYTVAIFANKDTQIIGSTWSNMFGILLTNAFSIVGTIMGVKYASEKKD
jgi:gamma-glutamylcysteine synthetase